MLMNAAPDFSTRPLLPAVIRDARSRATLMVAWMNEESFARTMESGETWFWSRSREELWHKGATSGNRQRVIAIATDCDRDTILVDVEPAGPACHTGAWSCFGDQPSGIDLDGLLALVNERKNNPPEGSYTAKLFAGGLDRILKKIGEEATEVVIAAKGEAKERLVEEIADLLFHLTVLMAEKEVAFTDVSAELGRRAGKRRAEGAA